MDEHMTAQEMAYALAAVLHLGSLKLFAGIAKELGLTPKYRVVPVEVANEGIVALKDAIQQATYGVAEAIDEEGRTAWRKHKESLEALATHLKGE